MESKARTEFNARWERIDKVAQARFLTMVTCDEAGARRALAEAITLENQRQIAWDRENVFLCRVEHMRAP